MRTQFKLTIKIFKTRKITTYIFKCRTIQKFCQINLCWKL